MGLIPGSGRSPGVGNGNPLQYSCLGNPMNREAWRATLPWGCKESDTTEHARTERERLENTRPTQNLTAEDYSNSL